MNTERAKELVGLLSEECGNMQDVQAMLKNLFAGTISSMLEAEMDEHLGYDKHSVLGNNSGNSRNGYGKKTLKSELGECEIAVPRDRNGEFSPVVMEKGQTRSDDLENRILAMYAKGLSTRDIEDHLRDIHGVEASASLISKIMPAVMEWQSRPLEAVYPIVFLDGIMFKVRKDARVINKCVYSVLGINMDGKKEILGMWISENESASFWTTVCNELNLIACRDNLSGFSTAIETVFPKTEQQLCVIHQIRNSTKYVSYKDVKTVMADLKLVYGAPTLDDAETKSVYPTDDSVRKSVYLSIMEITKKWSTPVKNWGIIMGQLMVFFEDRLLPQKGA